MESDIRTNCTELSYRLFISAAEFDVVRFAKFFDKTIDGWEGVVLGHGQGASRQFHAHVYWRQERKKPENVQLQVDFHRWKAEEKIRVAVPTADDFFTWAGQFISTPVANIHVHAEFALSTDTWQIKIMPLPLKIPYGGASAVVEGISIEIPTEPEGVDHCWVEIRKKRITVQLFAFRRIEFDSFEIGSDIEAFSSSRGASWRRKSNERPTGKIKV